MKTSSKTILFIHGLFLNSKSWENWIPYFEEKGFKCYAPSYPYHNGQPSDLRKNSPALLGVLTLNQVIKSIVDLIETMDEKPIIIGHSMGGLIVQKLLKMDKAAIGVCISSAPPQNINSIKWSFIRSNLPIINPFKGDSVFIPTIKWFHYAFCNTLSLEETKIIYEKYVVAESRNIIRSSRKNIGLINFIQPHAPLLFVGGEYDNIIPASLVKKNFKAYKHPQSIREFIIFPGRTHFICGQNNWEFVANYIFEWISKV